MRERLSGPVIVAAVAAFAACTVVSLPITRTSAQAPALKTPWGEPDLQGIWTVETDTPFQRSPRLSRPCRVDRILSNSARCSSVKNS